MAGTIVERELRKAAARFAVAQSDDDAAIRRLLRGNPMRGAVRLTFQREPDYFRGIDVAGGHDQTIVAFAHSRLVCTGRCIQRDCWVDGRVRHAGYLAELRLDETARSQFRILREGYGFFDTVQRANPAELYFTSIGVDNHRARRLLERGAPGFPSYVPLADLDTVLVTVPRRRRAGMLSLEQGTPDRIPDMLRLLNSHARRHQLATNWTDESLRALARHGLPLHRFVLALAGDEVVACGALWDQRGFRQTVIHGYTRALSCVRPLVNFGSRLFGTLRLPPPGSVLSHAFLSPLAFAEGAESMLADFVPAFFPLAAEAGIEFLTLALPSSDPRLPSLRRRFATRTWRSRLYRVDWPGRAALEFRDTAAPILPDVALL